MVAKGSGTGTSFPENLTIGLAGELIDAHPRETR